MTDNDVKDLVEKIRQQIIAEDIPVKELAGKAEVSYNTAKDFLVLNKKMPDFRTIVRLIDAADLDVRKTLGGSTILIETSSPEDEIYTRKFRRLNGYGKAYVKYAIDAFTYYERRQKRSSNMEQKK